MFKQAIYNANKTKCLETKYFTNKNNQIQIQRLSHIIKKVPKVLQNQIINLFNAFYKKQNEFIDGIQY
ncbi:hypothetical protein MNF30_01965 [Mycoplasma mycoides subsp. capri]|uniref:hypothetical protein n=1 Tax=Mycoplasma mycoides TaxID=2102 RepID=UPI002240DAE8|nr:hypothetical protein [Mycoplasma mycoides]UZK64559.1 hypothetical protein MNF30_01965 [Mycoplasma mycoides subsp. capri]